MGSVSDDGLFTATATGNVEVFLSLDGVRIGSITLHVVVPDTIYFTSSNINAFFGEAAALPLAALYQRKPVSLTAEDVDFEVSANEEGVVGGTVTGFDFTGDEASGLKTVTISAALAANTNVSDTITITMYNPGDVVFDFNNATGGDRRLAWLREVSNATTEDGNTYHVVDPAEAMVTDYTFAIDMSAIEVPAQLKDLTNMLPGADQTDGTAWGFLLQLADRVSDLSEVRAAIRIDPNFDVDLTGLSLQNEYFTLSSAQLDPQTNVLNVTLKWVNQSAAIEPATANPICVVSGIRLTPRAEAAWDENSSLAPVNSGTLSYEFYLSAGALYTFAGDAANQATYGLTPYINPDNSSDRGASFGADYASFSDTYTLVGALKNGWYFEEGQNVFYVDGILHTQHTLEKSVTTAPGCTEGGYTTHVCAVCGITYAADETEALGHSYVSVVTEPTCTEGGFTTHTCNLCGDSYVDTETDALGHDYDSGICTVCGTVAGVAHNTSTDTTYATVAEALEDAQEGQTVILLTDCTENTVMVIPGVTLDLNGCELTASYAVGFDTAHIIDGDGTGRLFTGIKNVVLDEENAMIPVYDGEGYLFTKAGFAIRQDDSYTSDGIRINAMAYPVQMEAVELLMDGIADNNIQVMIELTWDTTDGTGSQEFVFTDAVAADVYSSNNGSWSGYDKMFSMVITGFANIQNLRVNVAVVSGTNAQYISGTGISITG